MMAGSMPTNPDDARKLRRELERIATESIPALREAVRAGADDQTILDVLMGRDSVVVDVPEQVAAAVTTGGTGGNSGGAAQQQAIGNDTSAVVQVLQAMLAQQVNGNQLLAQQLDLLVGIQELLASQAGGP